MPDSTKAMGAKREPTVVGLDHFPSELARLHPQASVQLQNEVVTGMKYINLYSLSAWSDEVTFLLLPCSEDDHVSVHAVEGPPRVERNQ